MSEPEISDSLWKLMREVDTPTVCNAIEVAQGKRGFSNYTHRTMLRSEVDAEPVVGFARTAKIAGLEPPTEAPDVIKARRLEYFRSMASGPRPAVAVIEDIDGDACVSAWWGGVHTTVHKGLGLAGAVTNGVMRDLGDMEPGFPVLAGHIGPSHAFVHVRELGTPVEVFGMTCAEGDLVHSDQHGALVVPAEVIPILEASIRKLIETEDIIIGPARQPGFDIDKLEEAWRAFEKSRT